MFTLHIFSWTFDLVLFGVYFSPYQRNIICEYKLHGKPIMKYQSWTCFWYWCWKNLFLNVKLKLLFFLFFSICFFFFHEHSRFTGQQGKGEDIYLTPLYHFYPLHRHLDISRAVTAESSPLHIAGSRTRTRNLRF